MKKVLSLTLAAVLMLCLCSCTVKLSTTTAVPSEDIPENTVTPYEELSLEEKMEARSVVELIPANEYNADLLAPAMDSTTGLWGYISIQGEWKIAPSFKTALPFDGDYAKTLDEYQDIIFIDREGNTVVDTVMSSPVRSAGRFSNGIANITIPVEYTQQSMYINASGKSALAINKMPVTKGINYKTLRFLEIASPFREGKAVIMRTTNATLIANEDTRYPEVAYIINDEGVIQASIPQGLDVAPEGFDDNMRVIVRNNDGLYGLASDNGAIIASCMYRSIAHCEGSMYLVQDQESGLYGYMDKEGRRVVGFVYEDARPFSEGLAAVKTEEGWGFINDSGEVVIPFGFDSVKAVKAAVSGLDTDRGVFCSGVAAVSKGRFWAIIDSTGEILLAAESDDCPVLAVSDKYISFNFLGGCGVITTDGRYVLKPTFGAVGEFR